MARFGGETDARDEPRRSSVDGLYRRYAPWLMAMLRRRFGRAISDPEDVVQETYLRLATYSEARPIRHPQALLMRVADNLAKDRLRRDASATRSSAALAAAIPVEAVALATEQDTAVLLKQIVLSIPQPYRDTFVLSRYGGLTHAQIAQHCGVSINTVEWRMAQALSFCAARLAD